MNKKLIIGIIVLVALVVLAVLLLRSGSPANNEEKREAITVLDEYTEVATLRSNTPIPDAFEVLNGEAVILEGGGTFTASGDITVNGALGCRDGTLTLVSEGMLTINDTIACDNDGDGDVTLIAKNGLTMSPDARIVASGNIQIVDGEDAARTNKELEELYDEVEAVADGITIGPFIDEEETVSSDSVSTPSFAFSFPDIIPVAYAQGTTTVRLGAEPMLISGRLEIRTPRKGVNRIVVFDFPNTNEVTIQDFELSGPNGREGQSDTGGNCDAKGTDGEDAFRFNAYAPNLIVNNFTLRLGDGGEGGEAVTGNDCENAKAEGGKGGKPGNFRMIGSEKFEIRGAFMIHPGNGGAGGGATAKGKTGEPGQKGGDADATGGDGADNKKRLSVSGTVAGTSLVKFGDAVGGFGGSVLAEGGAGGDADKCGMAGGPGGKATAKSGDGGDAKLTVSGGAGRMEFANDIGGQGGIVEAYGGKGGNGGSCGSEAKGGDGGEGGDASATGGKGGLGKTGRAADGAELGDDGGDGGNGGNGCTEGIGGEGGSGGIEDGEKGEDGKNLCISVTKEEDYISLLPGEIQVIQYKDYYIPISNLQKFTDERGLECDGEEHWHPGPNGAVNTEGMVVPDPDPNNCGFGKTSEVPVLIIKDPNYVAPSEGQHQLEVRGLEGLQTGGGGGEMIQVDPPTLVIPAGVAQ